MMQIQFHCPQCKVTRFQSFDAQTTSLTCGECDSTLKTTENAVEGQHLNRCLVCPSTELFVRKNFPQRVGVAIVVIGFALSCWTWYQHMVITTFAILFATALIDVTLFAFVGELLECYRCHAQYFGVDNTAAHKGFDLEVHEKHRQQLARLAMAQQQTQHDR